ncbi:MAG: hypothetical protein E7390_01805 [Ruminococcaceae bacterium]|nr:hypothetical protein [Oscillospiraceae bacterium]
MKQTKRLAGLLLAVTVLCMFSALNCPAAEIGTEDFILNGSFEDLTETEQGGWTVYNSSHANKINWADMLKTDGASGEGNNYILIEAVKGADTCNSGLRHSNTQIEPGKDLLLSMKYKSSVASAMQIQYSYGASAYDVSYQPDKNIVLPSTGGAWTDYSVLIPAYAFEIEGVDAPVYADTIGFLFYNVARLYGEAGDTISVGFDSISMRTYADDGLVPNGDFTLGSTGWSVTCRTSGAANKTNWDATASVEFVDGMLKIEGKPQATSADITIRPTEDLLPDGITHMRYRLSFKYKAYINEDGATEEKPLGTPANISTSQVGMSYKYDTTTDANVNTTYLLRNPSPTYTRQLEDGWTECIYYTRNQKSGTNGSNNSFATTPASATAFGVQLKGLATGSTILYDDVVVTPLPYTVEKVVDSQKSECTAIAAGDSIIVSGVAANRTASEITPVMYVAFFSEGTDGKMLVSMQSVNTVNYMLKDGVQTSATLPANRSGIITSSEITVPAANDGESISMKVYVWSGSGLVPLGDTYALSEAVSAS